MSKFIRTENKIYLYNSEKNEIRKVYFKGVAINCFFENKSLYAVDGIPIIKQADTIEELCDYLMFVDNDEKEDILITDVDEINITYSKNETCYGCIKIKLPNGAIRIEPVAKFNEKWSFELI